MMSRKNPDYLIEREFSGGQGYIFLVRTDRRKDEYVEYAGNSSANISTINHTLQILIDDKPVREYDGIYEPWSLTVARNGNRENRVGSFASPYFKPLPANESLYLEKYMKRLLDNDVVIIKNIDYDNKETHVNLEFLGNNVSFIISNSVINIFEDFLPQEYSEEMSRWRKLFVQTLGHSFPYTMSENDTSKEAMIYKAKHGIPEYNNFIISIDDSGYGYNIHKNNN